MLHCLQWLAETCSSAKTGLCAVVANKSIVYILIMYKLVVVFRVCRTELKT